MSEQQEEGQVYQRLKRLRTASDAREYMQALVEAFDKNRISEKKARGLGYLIKIFLDTYQLSDLQTKVEELEEIINQRSVK
jgi:hypothetical protein